MTEAEVMKEVQGRLAPLGKPTTTLYDRVYVGGSVRLLAVRVFYPERTDTSLVGSNFEVCGVSISVFKGSTVW
jgi:hypothetical protein